MKNNANGSQELSGNKFKYTAYLYELDGIGERSMTEAKATGEALVPYANGYTSFDFYIDGGLTFDGTNMEKKYQIRIDIDSEHTVNESNEQDNRGWSDTWVTDYYKG